MRRTKEEAEQTRIAIMDAALSVFAEQGFDSSNLDEIAQKANVTRGAIYWHFKDKFGLFVQLVEDALDSYKNILRETLQTNLSPIQKIRSMVLSMLSKSQQSKACSRMSIMESTFRISNDEYEKHFRSIFTEFVNYIDAAMADIIKAGQDSGEIRADIEAQDVNFIIKSYIKGLSLIPRISTENWLDLTKSDSYVDVIIKGISK